MSAAITQREQSIGCRPPRGRGRWAKFALVLPAAAATVASMVGPVAAAAAQSTETGSTVAAQPGSAPTGTSAEPDPFHDPPLPTLGPVFIVDASNAAATSVGWIGLSPADATRVRIGIRDPAFFADPAFSVTLFAGTPGGRYGLVTANVVGKAPAAKAEKVDGAATSPLDDPKPSLPGPGIIEVGLPDAGAGALGADAMLWADTRYEHEGKTFNTSSSAFSLAQLRPPSAPTYQASEWARVQSGDGPKFVHIGAGPSLRITAATFEVTFASRPPTDVDGKPVSTVTDLVKIRPAGPSDLRAPYDLLIGEDSKVVSLHKPSATENLVIGEATVDNNSATAPRLIVPRAAIEAKMGGKITQGSLVGLTRRFHFADKTLLDVDGVAGPAIASAPGSTDAFGRSPDSPVAATSTSAGGRRLSRRLVIGVAGACALLIAAMFVLWFRTTPAWATLRKGQAATASDEGPAHEGTGVADEGTGPAEGDPPGPPEPDGA